VDTEFDYSFSIPNDFNYLNKVTTTEGFQNSDYRIEGSDVASLRILANETPIFLHYGKTITDASVLPDYLISALVYRLAARIAKPLTGEINEREMMNREYEKAIKQAKRRASQDKAPLRSISDDNSSYIHSHQYGDV